MQEIHICVHEGKYLVEWHLDTVALFEVQLENQEALVQVKISFMNKMRKKEKC